MWCRVVDPTFFSSWRKRSSFSGRRRIGEEQGRDGRGRGGETEEAIFLFGLQPCTTNGWGITHLAPLRVMALAILHLNPWVPELWSSSVWIWGVFETVVKILEHLQRKIYSWKYKHLHLISRTQVFIVAHPHTPSHGEWLHRSQENNPIFRNYSACQIMLKEHLTCAWHMMDIKAMSNITLPTKSLWIYGWFSRQAHRREIV